MAQLWLFLLESAACGQSAQGEQSENTAKFHTNWVKSCSPCVSVCVCLCVYRSQLFVTGFHTPMFSSSYVNICLILAPDFRQRTTRQPSTKIFTQNCAFTQILFTFLFIFVFPLSQAFFFFFFLTVEQGHPPHFSIYDNKLFSHLDASVDV